MANTWVRDLEERLVGAGGAFVRFTGGGHKLYRVGPAYLTLPNSTVSERARGHGAANYERQVTRLIKKHGVATPNEARAPIAPERVEDWTPPVVEATTQDVSDAEVDEILHEHEKDAGAAEAEDPTTAEPSEGGAEMPKGFGCETCERRFTSRQGRAVHQVRTHSGRRWSARGTLKDVRVPAPTNAAKAAVAHVGVPSAVLDVAQGVAALRERADRLPAMEAENERLRKENAGLTAAIESIGKALGPPSGRVAARRSRA